MIAFIDGHRGTYGVEPMCRVLPIAPSTYHDHVAKRRDRARLSVRGQRDLVLKPGIKRVFAENFGVYGYRKVWRQMKREGFDAPRCTVERLMRDMGLQGVIRGKPVRTTVSDKTAPCPLGLVRHSDRGSQYVSIKYTERLAEAGIEPSAGSVGDSYDNALAETINGLYKAEVIHRRGPWRSFEAVEYATLEWVGWFNNKRLLEPVGNIPPAQAEKNYHATLDETPMAA